MIGRADLVRLTRRAEGRGGSVVVRLLGDVVVGGVVLARGLVVEWCGEWCGTAVGDAPAGW